MVGAATHPLVVFKLGGSLVGSPRLEHVLGDIVARADVRAVVVPGGGPFADAVRVVQAALPFDDGLAHRLALDAMAHLGEVLATRHPSLAVAPSFEAVAEAHRRGVVPIWVPVMLRGGHADIPESWSVTSDSLALWLARKLGAAELVLVKSTDATAADSIEAMAAAGAVDAAFPCFAADFDGRVVIAGPSGERLVRTANRSAAA